jgi:hypothetical protein
MAGYTLITGGAGFHRFKLCRTMPCPWRKGGYF